MKCYPLGPVSPRFTTIASSTNATPIVVTTTAAHGLNATDTITISSHLTNTNANGTYAPGSFLVTATTITLLGVAGNGSGTTSGFASAPTQLIAAANFPSIPGITVAGRQNLMVCKLLFVPAPAGTATLYVGVAGLNQYNLSNVFRPINPPPASGIYDYYDVEADGTNVIPIADYWVDAEKPGTEATVCTFWLR